MAIGKNPIVGALRVLCSALGIASLVLLLPAAAPPISGVQPGDIGRRQLFNGKDLAGWNHVGPGSMTVDSGLLRGHGGMGLLLYWAGQKFIEPREEWMPVHYGESRGRSGISWTSPSTGRGPSSSSTG